MYSKEGLADNKWHTIKVLREGARLILQIDNDEPATGKYYLNRFSLLCWFWFFFYNLTLKKYTLKFNSPATYKIKLTLLSLIDL